MAVFSFIDDVSEVRKSESITAFFLWIPARNFSEDHFGDFPVMPGVLQVESLRQAASRLLAETEGPGIYRLESIGSVKYGQFVKPGSRLKIFVRFLKKENSSFRFDGRIDLMDGDRALGRVIAADFSMAAAD